MRLAKVSGALTAALVVMMGMGCQTQKSVALAASAQTVNPLTGAPGEEYYMVTFLSGIEYWKGCFRGFEAAGKMYGVRTIYTGAPEYDVNKSVTVLEQVIAKNPAGIALTCMNPDAYVASINRAIDLGIPVVTFDADAPASKRYSFLATGNYAAGVTAARHLAGLVKGEGEVGIVTLPGQLNHEQRTAGFKETIRKEFPKMNVVQVGNGSGDQAKAAAAAAGIIQAHPGVVGVFATDATSGVGCAAAVKEAGRSGKVRIISFDTDKGTLDAIREGSIDASIAQGTWQMGFWSMQFAFQLRHGLINPVAGWKQKKMSPLPPYVDTGVDVVTKDNVDAYGSAL